MNFISIGKIVNTHGIKGEVRIISSFEKKDLVFKPNFKLYIGEFKNVETINSYRKHKNFDMVTFQGIDDINEVLKYKGNIVYINKDDLNLQANDYLLSDLIGCQIIEGQQYYGEVTEILETKANILLKVRKDKEYFVPYLPEFITKVDLNKKEIEVNRAHEFYEI